MHDSRASAPVLTFTPWRRAGKMIICGVRCRMRRGWPGIRMPMSASMRCATRSTARWRRAISAGISRPPRTHGRTRTAPGFLRHAAERIAARGGKLANADVTIICERPKITPHAPAMRARLAELLGVSIDLISVKATTTEKLGFTGRGEGIAAQAAVIVMVPA